MKRTKKSCPKCGKEISLSNYEKHVSSCCVDKNESSLSLNEDWKISDNEYKCPYCDKIYPKKGVITHIWRKHGEGINLKTNSSYNNDRFAWNKGLTKETDERVAKFGETYSNGIKDGSIVGSFLGRHHTEDTIKVISKKLSSNNRGGRCKWYEVEKPDGTKVKVQGTWERDFAKVLNFIDEEWIKPSQYQEHTFKWADEGIQHSYTPDFYSPKLKKYFEVKGYWWGNDKRKMELVLEQNDINIEVIQKKELERYLQLIS